jgi:hypothetical protein
VSPVELAREGMGEEAGGVETVMQQTTFHETDGIAAVTLGGDMTARAEYGAGA